MRHAPGTASVHPSPTMALSTHDDRADSPALSPRQREVLSLLAAGTPAREIAHDLDRSEATVRNHIRAVLRKLGCHSQLEAVAAAHRLGLLGPGGAGAGERYVR